MLHKRTRTYQVRDIENFEVTTQYYLDTWINGNKKHVAEELSELMICSLPVFMSILCELPKDIQTFVLNSDFYSDANLHLTLKRLTYKSK